MRIVLTGATGFLGRPLVAYLAHLGYECIVQTRDVAKAATLGWPPTAGLASCDDLPAADVVIHLAGESLIGYWTPRKRREILESRVEGTRRLVAAMRSAKTRPHTLLAASAVGIYGHRPGEPLEETAPPDSRNRFRAEVCRAWEEAANAADALGVRVVNLRLGNIFDPGGGYLGGLMPIYRHFGGWMFGEPDAAIPWISRTDAVRLIGFALANERWYGPLNVVAPQAITHRELAMRVSERLGHHGIRKVPVRLTRAVLGEFASALVDDQRVVPAKALTSGFAFEHATFESWIDEALPIPRKESETRRQYREMAHESLDDAKKSETAEGAENSERAAARPQAPAAASTSAAISEGNAWRALKGNAPHKSSREQMKIWYGDTN